MRLLLRSADPQVRFRSTSVTISGSGSDWHDVESYFRPNALGSYSFDANNNIVFNRNERLFDLAIMMDCSQCPIHPQLKTVFREYARKHSDTVRKHGAKPVWFMSWAYADKPEMTEELAEAYTQAGNDNNAFVIPAGLAFARALKQRPIWFSMHLTSGTRAWPGPISRQRPFMRRCSRSPRPGCPTPQVSMRRLRRCFRRPPGTPCRTTSGRSRPKPSSRRYIPCPTSSSMPAAPRD